MKMVVDDGPHSALVLTELSEENYFKISTHLFVDDVTFVAWNERDFEVRDLYRGQDFI